MFFTLSKVLWFLANPGNLLLITLCLGTALLWSRWRTVGRLLVASSAIIGVVLSVLPIGQWLYGTLEERFPPVRELPADVDGIIVTGGIVDPVITATRGQTAVGGAVERLFAMAMLAKRYPTAKLVFTGGSGMLLHQDEKEAPAVLPLLAQLGVDPGRIILEGQSRNTAENAQFSYIEAKPKPDEKWLLVTSAFHMPRAVGSFRKAGWTVTAYPVDYVTRGESEPPIAFNFAYGVGSLGSALHEYLGLVFYWLSGNTDEIFPAP